MQNPFPLGEAYRSGVLLKNSGPKLNVGYLPLPMERARSQRE